MRILTWRGLALGICLLLAPAAGLAQSSGDAMANAQAFMNEARDRLQLSTEQASDVMPILRQSFERQKEILDRYGVDLEAAQAGEKQGLGWRKARKLGREMDDVREATALALSGYLDDRQLAEFRALQEERKQRTRERIRANR